jgi:prepilin-type N-terminal cleavage/methylation domain-containing protein/prepilin-type processing-associated H-X9-DG protein
MSNHVPECTKLSYLTAKNALWITRNQKHTASAFTLTEILVVLAIIVVLAALLFPQAQKMMNRADESKFISNLKAVSAGLLLCAADDNGRIPAFSGADASTMWQVRVAPHLGENPSSPIYSSVSGRYRSVMRDPGDRTLYQGKTPIRNIAINGDGNLVPSGTAGASPPYGACNRMLSTITYPSKMALLGPGTASEISTDWGSGARLRYVDLNNALASDLKNFRRYGDYMHFAFVDGHVEKLPLERVKSELNLNKTGKSIFFDRLNNNGGQ